VFRESAPRKKSWIPSTGLTRRTEENVGRFDITVHNLVAVGMLQRVGDIGRQVDCSKD
jgi:hypothetical protein